MTHKVFFGMYVYEAHQGFNYLHCKSIHVYIQRSEPVTRLRAEVHVSRLVGVEDGSNKPGLSCRSPEFVSHVFRYFLGEIMTFFLTLTMWFCCLYLTVTVSQQRHVMRQLTGGRCGNVLMLYHVRCQSRELFPLTETLL